MISKLINRYPTLSASSIYAIAVLLAFNQIFNNRVLLPEHSDQKGGYPPRLFAAEFFREHGSLPEWSPHLFGGFPFISNTGFGDTFFPTAILRLIFPVDVGMALGLILFVFLAGVFAFLFLRSLSLSWAASFVGGGAYMFSGMVISLVSPGHDGKLYVSAMLPLALMFIYKGVSRNDWHQYLYFGVVVGLSLLSPHFQATYYLLMGAGFFWFFMVFLSGEKQESDPWWRSALLFTGALFIGFAVAAVQLLPFMEYLPFSARGDVASADRGWIYHTAYSLPPEEIPGLFLPGLNSVTLESYFGQNPLKFHSDYMGAIVCLLALVSFKLVARRKMAWFFVFLAVYALLFSLGAHTPFYSIPYTVLPYIAKTRAPAIILFLASLSVAVFAAFGFEYLLGKLEEMTRATKRVVEKTVPLWQQIEKPILYGFAFLAFVAILAAAGALRPLTESFASIPQVGLPPESHPDDVAGRLQALEVNYPLFVQQILLTTVLTAAALALLLPVVFKRLGRDGVALYVGILAMADLWTLERNYIRFSDRASVLFAADEVVTALKADSTVHRVMPIPSPFLRGFSTYGQNYLMAHRIRSAAGYNSFELHAFDELLGGKNSMVNLMTPRLWHLLGTRYVLMTEPIPPVDSIMPRVPPDIQPLFREYFGAITPVGEGLRSFNGMQARLYRVNNPLPFAFLVPQAWRVEADLDVLVATLMSPQFHPEAILLVPKTSPVGVDAQPRDTTPISNAVRTTEIHAGKFRFELERPADSSAFLFVAENWYPAWKAKVDGADAPVLKAQATLMAVPIAAGSRLVELDFVLDSYHLGRIISLLAVIAVLGIAVFAYFQRRRPRAAV